LDRESDSSRETRTEEVDKGGEARGGTEANHPLTLTQRERLDCAIESKLAAR